MRTLRGETRGPTHAAAVSPVRLARSLRSNIAGARVYKYSDVKNGGRRFRMRLASSRPFDDCPIVAFPPAPIDGEQRRNGPVSLRVLNYPGVHEPRRPRSEQQRSGRESIASAEFHEYFTRCSQHGIPPILPSTKVREFPYSLDLEEASDSKGTSYSKCRGLAQSCPTL